MVVVVGDLVTFMNGSGPVGNQYTFFRIYEIHEDTVSRYFDMADHWANEQISTTTQTSKANLYDDLILTEGALRLTEHIYSEVMATGFSYSTLQFSVQTGTFPQVLQSRCDAYKKQKDELLGMLKKRIDVSQQTQWDDNPYGIVGDNFHQTAPWRGGL